MSDDKRFLITPPPGLLPEPPAQPVEPAPTRADEVAHDSSTRRLAPNRPPAAPAFPFGSPPAAPPATAAPAAAPPVVAPAPAASLEADVPTGENPVLRPGWSIQLPGGVQHPVTTAGLVLGRNPSAPERWPDAQAVLIADPDRSVSKTHALLVVVGDELRLIDLASTNGVAVTADGLRQKVAHPDGVVVGDPAVIELGSFQLGAARD